MVLLELFSGIGGFSKGLQAAGYSFEKVYFSEIEKNAIANFKYNFPYAEHIGSVTEIGTARIEHPDINELVDSLHRNKGEFIGNYVRLTRKDTEEIYRLAQ